jgi:hypothetical protein
MQSKFPNILQDMLTLLLKPRRLFSVPLRVKMTDTCLRYAVKSRKAKSKNQMVAMCWLPLNNKPLT